LREYIQKMAPKANAPMTSAVTTQEKMAPKNERMKRINGYSRGAGPDVSGSIGPAYTLLRWQGQNNLVSGRPHRQKPTSNARPLAKFPALDAAPDAPGNRPAAAAPPVPNLPAPPFFLAEIPRGSRRPGDGGSAPFCYCRSLRPSAASAPAQFSTPLTMAADIAPRQTGSFSRA
jgi:hypothetical protein